VRLTRLALSVEKYVPFSQDIFPILRKLRNRIFFLKRKLFPKPNQRDHAQNFLRDKSLNILEIGPFTNPTLVGANVRYFDLMDKTALTERAKLLNLDGSKIPIIDFIHPEGDLNFIAETFDAIFSAHVIEHQPDLIRHLQAVENLISKSSNPTYYLIVPDKRYCFDSFLPESSLREIINNFEKQVTRPDRLHVIEHQALTTHNYSFRHWRGDRGKVLKNVREKWSEGEKIYKDNQEKYIDTHMWQFTPESFTFIMDALNALGYTKFRINKIIETYKYDIEFAAVLTL